MSTTSRSQRRPKSRKRKRVSNRTQTGLVIPRGAKRCLALDERGNELWAIENIIDEREIDGKTQYRVKWEGWPYRYCTWETEESFLENMDIIKDFVKQKNEGIRRRFCKVEETDRSSRLQGPRNSNATSRSRNSSRSPVSQSDSDGDETKVRIQKITIPAETGLIEASLDGEIAQNSITYLNPTTEPMDIFLCRDAQAMKLEQAEKEQAEKMSVEDPDSDDDYFREVEDDENPSKSPLERSICDNDFDVPLVANEFEKSANFKIVIEECFMKVSGQIESLHFKVAFYDEETFKSYDYFSYDEIKQKNWSGALLDFYAKELLSEVKPNCTKLTPNIRVV